MSAPGNTAGASAPAASRRQRIALVLGSGGARGLAHIGVIRCLRERGFDICYISGCSIGALIGGIHAAGKLEEYTEWVCELQRLDVLRLLDWSFRRGALFAGERVVRELKQLVGELDIEELPIGFTAVATELMTGREIWLSRGPLWDAVRASMAVPMVFSPVVMDGQILVDGGLVNPIPMAPALNAASAWVVAVDLNGRAERQQTRGPWGGGRPMLEQLRAGRAKLAGGAAPETPGMFDLALRSMDAMQITIARMKLAAYSPRLTIGIPRDLCTFFEFHRARELIEFGYQRARACLEREGY
jgi:NTE family protein